MRILLTVVFIAGACLAFYGYFLPAILRDFGCLWWEDGDDAT